jgi:Domain of Unknown Function with PDB structure (DUF3857)
MVGHLRRLIGFLAFVGMMGGTLGAWTQEPAPKPTEKTSQAPEEKEKPAGKPELPFQIQLLETHIRFESNGDARKEVHTIVKIINILGARQFSRISFDYNRSFQQVEIPLVRVSHANGGTSELLPSAVTDTPNPVVEPFPAFQDVRIKAVRILGLQEGDTVEYRVITTTTHAPLAPNFWLDHTFDRSGQVLQQIYELDLPGHINSTIHRPDKNSIHAGVPWTDYHNAGTGKEERSLFEWKLGPDVKLPEQAVQDGVVVPDVLVTTFQSSFDLAQDLEARIPKWSEQDKKAVESWLMIGGPLAVEAWEKLRLSYRLVSQRLTTVDLPLDASGFQIRPVKQILDSGYATPEEKCAILLRFAQSNGLQAEMLFYGDQLTENSAPRPAFQKVFVLLRQLFHEQESFTALDPAIEVAPFGMIPAQYRGKKAMSLSLHSAGDYAYHWITLPETLPFRSRQEVSIAADISKDGQLRATVKYAMRGENELLLRVAFHQTPKDKWKDVANLLAISDGFRGQITSVNASDPLQTNDPFTVEYELTQAKFVDWSKKAVRIPALLPQIGLPDVLPAGGSDQPAPQIELGTPLDVQTTMTLHLPGGTTVETPPGTNVSRDYATYTSKYTSTQNTATASRHISFLKREIPGDRTIDYTTFVHAVQSDQAQRLTVVSGAAASQQGNP